MIAYYRIYLIDNNIIRYYIHILTYYIILFYAISNMVEGGKRLNGNVVCQCAMRVPSLSESELLQHFQHVFFCLALKYFRPVFVNPITFRHMDLSLMVLSFIQWMFPQFLIYTKTPYSPSTQPLLYSRVWILYLCTCLWLSSQRVWHYKGNIVLKDPKGTLMALSSFWSILFIL